MACTKACRPMAGAVVMMGKAMFHSITRSARINTARGMFTPGAQPCNGLRHMCLVRCPILPPRLRAGVLRRRAGRPQFTRINA